MLKRLSSRDQDDSMRFIEMTGKTLTIIIDSHEQGQFPRLEDSGVDDESIVRVNEHGDIEVRRNNKWDVIGGLLGDYSERVKRITGLDWA
jgi:hypothetical protein